MSKDAERAADAYEADRAEELDLPPHTISADERKAFVAGFEAGAKVMAAAVAASLRFLPPDAWPRG